MGGVAGVRRGPGLQGLLSIPFPAAWLVMSPPGQGWGVPWPWHAGAQGERGESKLLLASGLASLEGQKAAPGS